MKLVLYSTSHRLLLAASAEVGQSILTPPYVFSLVGYTAGIILEFLFAALTLYTLVSMHLSSGAGKCICRTS